MTLPQSETMRSRETGGVPFYTFRLFEGMDFLRHGFSTRLGGVSGGVWESMNLGFSRGDDPAAVTENYARLCRAMGMNEQNLVISCQTHGTNLYNATEDDRGRGIFREKGYDDIDGLLTDRPGVALCTLYADCVPLFFADPVKKVVAAAHAGWKGTAARIGAETVARMTADYGCDPADIRAGIGPSIGPCCFEVDSPVAEVFAGLKDAKNCIKDDKNGKFHVDLWSVNRQILLNAGLQPARIAVGGLCTRCRPDVFWSHRHAGPQRGSLAAFIEIKS